MGGVWYEVQVFGPKFFGPCRGTNFASDYPDGEIENSGNSIFKIRIQNFCSISVLL